MYQAVRFALDEVLEIACETTKKPKSKTAWMPSVVHSVL
jgi:hypothetical protein